MNKLQKTIPLLLVAFSLVAICYAEGAGLGISDYEAHPQIRIGEDSPSFQIARISNEGTLNLTITPKFTPYYNETDAGLEFVFTPNSTFLQPEDSVMFVGKVVSASKTGTFEGMVEFKIQVHLPPDFQGNPSTPGASAKITVTIIEPMQNAFAWFVSPIGLVVMSLVTGMPTASLIYIFIRKRQPARRTKKYLKWLQHGTGAESKIAAVVPTKAKATIKPKEPDNLEDLYDSLFKRQNEGK